jgi:hypothetical protein
MAVAAIKASARRVPCEAPAHRPSRRGLRDRWRDLQHLGVARGQPSHFRGIDAYAAGSTACSRSAEALAEGANARSRVTRTNWLKTATSYRHVPLREAVGRLLQVHQALRGPQ